MRDLVVAREGRVHRRAAAHHVRDDPVDDEVAHEDAHRGAHERIRAAPMAPRTHVAALAAQGRRPLEDHLEDEQDEHARDVEPVGEERAVAGVRALLLGDAADGQDHVLGLAREQVAAARAAVAQQADAGRAGGARSPRSRPAASRSSSARSPSRPTGTRGCPRSSRAGSRPGWRRSGRRGRSPTRRARASPPATQRAICGALPSRMARCSTGSAEAVDLEEDDPRHVRAHLLARAPRDPLRHAQHVRLVVVRPEDRIEGHGGDRRDERGPERCPPGVDGDRVRRDVRGEHEHRRVEQRARAGTRARA